MFFHPLVLLPGLGPPTYVCRNCGKRIAFEEDLVEALDRPSRATYFNPYGVPCEIRTFSRADNVEQAPFSTDEHTWFEGYAWCPVGCAGCRVHLGWRYEAVESHLEPPVFFGFLTTALMEAGREP